MKLNTSFLTALAVIAASGAANAAITVTSGTLASTTVGEVRDRSFRSGTVGEVFVGPNPGQSGGGTVQNNNEIRSLFNWGSENAIKVVYDPISKTLSSTVDIGNNGSVDVTTTYNYGIGSPVKKPADFNLNYMQLSLFEQSAGVSVTLTDAQLKVGAGSFDTVGTGTFGILATLQEGKQNWWLTGNFNSGFEFKGVLKLSGTFPTSQESDKFSLYFGNSAVVPEPSTYLAGALLGLPLLVGGVRKLRQNRGK